MRLAVGSRSRATGRERPATVTRRPSVAQERDPTGWKGSILQEILSYYAALLAGAEDFGLLNDYFWILIETVAVAARAGRNTPGHDRITRLTNLVKVRFLSDFRRFRRSLGERHDLVSSDLARMHDQFCT